MIFPISMVLILILHVLFYLGSKKEKWELLSKSAFECGYTAYFFSRFSFSIHYFLIALIFLFLDLELCFLISYFNEESFNTYLNFFFLFFSLILTMSLILEWMKGLIEWKN